MIHSPHQHSKDSPRDSDIAMERLGDALAWPDNSLLWPLGYTQRLIFACAHTKIIHALECFQQRMA